MSSRKVFDTLNMMSSPMYGVWIDRRIDANLVTGLPKTP